MRHDEGTKKGALLKTSPIWFTKAYSKLALSEFMQKAHTITHLPTWLRNFVNMVRTWLHTASSLIHLGDGLASLTKQAQAGKLAPDSGISPDLLENIHTLTNSLRSLWLEKGIELGTQEAEQITATLTTSTTTAGYQGFLNLSNKEKAEARQKLTLTTTPIEKGTKTKTIVHQLCEKFRNKRFDCVNSIIAGIISRSDCEKMASFKATSKSIANGFSYPQHVSTIRNIDSLFKYAIRWGEFDDKNNDQNVKSVNRFLAPVKIDNEVAAVLITVKHTTDDKTYSAELCKLNDLDGNSKRLQSLHRIGDAVKRPEANFSPSRSLDESIAEFRNYVKEVFPEAATQLNGFTGGYSMDVEVPPDKTLIAAHTISTSKAKDALRLGFAPHPSVAITNVNSFYDWNWPDYSVTFLAGRDFIDPAISPVDIYHRDAWTGVMPLFNIEIQNPQFILDLAWDLEQVAKERGFFDKIEDTLARARSYASGELGLRSDSDIWPLLNAYFCFVEKNQDYDEITKEQLYNDEAYWKFFCDAQPDYENWEQDWLSSIRIFKFESEATGKSETTTAENLHEHMLVAKNKGLEFDTTEPSFHRFTVMANPEYQSVEEVQEQRDNVHPDEKLQIRLERYYNEAEYELRKFLNRAAKVYPKARDLDSEQVIHDIIIPDVSKRYEVDDYSIYQQLVDLCGARADDGLASEEFDDLNPQDAYEAIAQLAELALTMPTRYMEAVPRRSVKFSEFQIAVVSDKTAKNEPVLMAQLRDLGIEIKVFDSSDKNAFLRTIKEFAIDYGFSADAVEGVEVHRAITPEERTLVAKFHSVESLKPIVCDEPKVYVEDAKEAKKAVRETYRKLQGTTVMTTDGKEVGFSRRGFNEVTLHAGDRRVLASIPYLPELIGSASFMYSADNSQKEKAKKSSITKYHYYLNKGNFPQYSAWARRHNQVHGKSGDALILIAVAEFENGDLFYDLDATDVEIVENEKGTSSSLEVARIPTTSLQASDVPFSGRLHNLKRYVNHIDNKITGGHSLCVGKKAKNWKTLPSERKFKSVLDGRMRCELDAHQYRLTDKLQPLVYPQPEDYAKLESYYNEIIALVEYFTDSTVGEYKTFHVSEGRQKLLKGSLDLYDGYVVNEFEHGEFADLLSLGDFLLGLPIAKTKSNTFVIENKKLKDLAIEIAEHYNKKGIHVLNIAPLGEVVIDKTGVENSIGHFTRNTKTSKEHKQRVCDAFALVPDVLERGVLVEYGA